MEKPIFIKSKGIKLFGMIHFPDACQKENGMGIILCSPFAEEKLWSQRVIVNFARYLASEGYCTLRFDYQGNGDSDGRFENATIETMVKDIVTVSNWFRQETGMERIGLLGLRLGASLATIASRQTDIEFLILWEPVIDGKAYLQQCLRSNLATQLAIYRKIIHTRDQLIEKLEMGENVNIDGYLISPSFYKQIVEINLINEDILPYSPILTCKISKTKNPTLGLDFNKIKEMSEKINEKSDFKIIKEMPFWGELKVYFQKPDNLYDVTTNWIKGLDQNMPFKEKNGGEDV